MFKQPINLCKLISLYPMHAVYILQDPLKTRKFWYKDIFENRHITEIDRQSVLSILIESKIIPDEQLDELVNQYIKLNYSPPSGNLFRNFKEIGYYEKVYEIIFKSKNYDFNFGNRHGEMIIDYLENNQIDINIVKYLSTMLSGSIHPWRLKERLNNYFSKNKVKKDEFFKIGLENSISITNKINP
ncbi:MAG: hypothetical protein GPI99_17080 [Microcystis aeruginosa W13-15]|nr:hypothetical protein [Microcystis aeruginosa W13-15]